MPIRKTPTASNFQTGALVALVPRTIFSAASNTTGNKIIAGTTYEAQSANGLGHYVIATSAPAAITDGLVISELIYFQSAATNFSLYKIKDDIFVPSGYGLYWVSNISTVATTNDVSWSAA